MIVELLWSKGLEFDFCWSQKKGVQYKANKKRKKAYAKIYRNPKKALAGGAVLEI